MRSRLVIVITASATLLSSLEAGAGRQRFSEVDLSGILDRVFQAYLPVAEDTHHGDTRAWRGPFNRPLGSGGIFDELLDADSRALAAILTVVVSISRRGVGHRSGWLAK